MNDAKLARAWLAMPAADRPVGEWRCGRCHELTGLHLDQHEAKSVCCDSVYLHWVPGAVTPGHEVRVQGRMVESTARPALASTWFVAMRQAVEGAGAGPLVTE